MNSCYLFTCCDGLISSSMRMHFRLMCFYNVLFIGLIPCGKCTVGSLNFLFRSKKFFVSLAEINKTM